MNSLFEELTLGSFSFVKHVGGTILTPYATYRRLIEKGRRSETLFLGFCCVIYFSVSSLVKTQAFRPLLLTEAFIELALGAFVGYLFVVGLLYGLGRLAGGIGAWGKVALAWSYSLIPTLIWFLATSLLYLFLPPPRTQAPLGVLFSLIYLLFSAVLFFWKAELYYLTLRFGMRLTLKQILYVTGVFVPVLCMYSVVMYQLGIFRVPFI
jgi:hypothetical protein